MDWRENLSTRKGKRVRDFIQAQSESGQIKILTSSSDWGVVRNGGRRGSLHAPLAILSSFKAMATPKNFPTLETAEVANHSLEEYHFEKAQSEEAKLIKEKQKLPLLHIGGGHDHAYPLLKGLRDSGHKSVHVINIDAHLDTRIDPCVHSGTPFRQVANEVGKDFRMTQLGIHDYANVEGNYEDLPGKMKILGLSQLRGYETFSKALKKEVKIKDHELTILSLDCDALHSSFMEGVSAVNHDGFQLEEMQSILSFYQKHTKDHVFGLYEYNPKLDNLSNKGSRALAALLYQFCLETLI